MFCDKWGDKNTNNCMVQEAEFPYRVNGTAVAGTFQQRHWAQGTILHFQLCHLGQ